MGRTTPVTEQQEGRDMDDDAQHTTKLRELIDRAEILD
jgi:hypothetical protein